MRRAVAFARRAAAPAGRAVLVALALLSRPIVLVAQDPAGDTLAVASVEPPPESPEGADYAAEPADSLDDGSVELGFGAAGRGGRTAERRRRVRFAGDGVSGTLREGRGDPLAGGGLDGRMGGGEISAGRLAPRWGRGLLLGAPGDPWRSAASDRGARAGFRGRAGEGVSYRRARDGIVLEALGGRFARSDLVGLRTGGDAWGLGLLAARHARPQSSIALGRGDDEVEVAFDGRGRWRAATLLERPFGTGRVSALARGGHARFRSLAEPGRSGPARAVAIGIEGGGDGLATRVAAAAWRFRPGVAGARLALEVVRAMPHHASLAWGFEEQHGSRRDPPPRAAGLRQALWASWRSAPGPLRLALRHEVWGDHAVARGAVRVVSTAGLEALGPARTWVRVSHTAFRSKSGESLYLPEIESDRLVLRALSGVGRRTRVELDAPLASGRLRAALGVADANGRRTRPQWTLDWSRRARTRAVPP